MLPYVCALGLITTLLAWRAAIRPGALQRLALAGVLTGALCSALSAWVMADQLLAAWRHHLPLHLNDVLLGPREHVVTVETFTFAGTPDAPLQLDVYRSRDSPRGAVVVVHGGAWRYGDKGENAVWSRWLAAQGYLVADVQYRLAGRATWREAVEDIHQAIGWVREYQRASSNDTPPITLLGRSAGGHLALLAAYTTADARLPARVIAFYAPSDLEQLHAEARGPLAEDLRNGIEALAGASTYRSISPTDHVHPGSPPTLLVHGTWDTDVPIDHSEALAAALRMADVPVELVRVPFALHGFDLIPQGIATHMSRQAVLKFLTATK